MLRTITRKQHQTLLLLLMTRSILSPRFGIPPIPQIQQRPAKLSNRDVLLLRLRIPIRWRLIPIGIPRCVTGRYGILLTDSVDIVECEDWEKGGHDQCRAIRSDTEERQKRDEGGWTALYPPTRCRSRCLRTRQPRFSPPVHVDRLMSISIRRECSSCCIDSSRYRTNVMPELPGMSCYVTFFATALIIPLPRGRKSAKAHRNDMRRLQDCTGRYF